MQNTTEPLSVPLQFLGGSKRLLIGGKWVPPSSGEEIDALNPADGKVIGRLARGNAADVDRAVAAARAAFEGPWSRWKPLERQQLLMRINDLLLKHGEELATIETMDMGAPLSRTRGTIKWISQLIHFFASCTGSSTTATASNSLPGRIMTLIHKAPLGVVGGIIPWNGPLGGQWWTLGPALATGCTCVLKPAEDASLSILRFAEIMAESGVPDGVVNIVTGYGGEAGAALAAHPGVDKISFTGSTETGRRIVEASAGNLKRLQLELGGKSPDIVFADADLDRAVPGAAMAVFTNSGQICYSGTRLFVQRSVQDEFVERLKKYSATLKVGNGLQDGIDLGPLISQRQLDRVMGYMKIGPQEGAVLSAGGTRLGWRAGLGLFRRTDGVLWREQRDDHRARGDLRPGDLGDPLRHRRRSAEDGQRHRLRTGRRRVDAQPDHRTPGLTRHPLRRRVGQLLWRGRPERWLRWREDERLRLEGRPGAR